MRTPYEVLSGGESGIQAGLRFPAVTFGFTVLVPADRGTNSLSLLLPPAAVEFIPTRTTSTSPVFKNRKDVQLF